VSRQRSICLVVVIFVLYHRTPPTNTIQVHSVCAHCFSNPPVNNGGAVIVGDVAGAAQQSNFRCFSCQHGGNGGGGVNGKQGGMFP